MRHVHVGPKFPHASGDVIGVLVELLTGLEGNHTSVRLTGERRQVHDHALRQRQEKPTDARLITWRAGLEDAKALIEARE
jgi:hypothetical protein